MGLWTTVKERHRYSFVLLENMNSVPQKLRMLKSNVLTAPYLRHRRCFSPCQAVAVYALFFYTKRARSIPPASQTRL